MRAGAVIPWGQTANSGGAAIFAGTVGAERVAAPGVADKGIQELIGSGCW